ncbi:MAG: CorA family divalent cation transporter [Chthoniobacterales bacterium]|nr:CorA family divalent cation transporter [Chthoniobacterales bacterium]
MNPTTRQLPTPAWHRLFGENDTQLPAIQQQKSWQLNQIGPQHIFEDANTTYFRIDAVLASTDGFFSESFLLLWSGKEIFSIEPSEGSRVCELAATRLQQTDQPPSPEDILLVILQTASDMADSLLEAIGDQLYHCLIQTNAVLSSLESKKKDFGVSDVITTQLNLGKIESLLTQAMDNQLILARIARHAAAICLTSDPQLSARFRSLVADIEGTGELVEFAYQRIRVLQQNNNLALAVKQNQIIKIFSIVAAIFLPPLLISTYYSMNVVNMPILEWQYGLPMVIIASFLLAFIPLIYIKNRGWLR